ncbi:hypothetical protein [Flammeovirga kamogawensis]|uniref:DUF1579 domain-containing protein n=1 Tax=Flammeovirga kamogawensis TaxID=373891 RepID=A0ABX8H1I0_9BACT|nr:hypothetical protein [Flammeovirga kamogawensis]MBB6463740.1 hypothetical protein [Flammeovirga kamogawensis]QWG09748.1 hypothetical protein KM029_24425 [Flammeovirga kamogawensis]TRX65261.1 hypothetical protein EO216_22315 [Flammeovirga kamogawensis]
MQLHCENQLLHNSFSLFQNKKLISTLDEKKWLNTILGSWKGQKFIFKYTSIWNTTKVKICTDEYKKIGEIKWNLLKNKASIVINDKRYTWSYKSLIGNKWQIKDQNEVIVDYTTNFSTGSISSSSENGLLFLTGLTIHQFHYQSVALLICTLIPVISSFIA